MADNKKYYYLKLKDNFFDGDAMVILESMPDGYLYSNILLKLYLRSLKHQGKLMFNEVIPYNPTILAQVTRHSVGVVEKALSVFQQLGLIEILDNGAIYMIDIQNFIGNSSSEADRKREYRYRIEMEKGQMSNKCLDKNPPKKEIEIEIDIDKDINKEKEIDTEKEKKKEDAKASARTQKHKYGEYNNVLLKDTDLEKLKIEYGEDKTLKAIKYLDEYIEMKGAKYKSHYLVIRKWVVDAVNEREKKGNQSRGSQSMDDFVQMGKEWIDETRGVFDNIVDN